MSFSRDLPDKGIEPKSPELGGSFFTTEPPGKPIFVCTIAITNCNLKYNDEKKRAVPGSELSEASGC